MLDHLASDSLGRHEDTGDVDAHHLVNILGGVLKGRGLLLDAGSGDEAIEAAVLGGNGFNEGVEVLNVADISATVVQRGAELVLGAEGDLAEVWVRLSETVNGVD